MRFKDKKGPRMLSQPFNGKKPEPDVVKGMTSVVKMPECKVMSMNEWIREFPYMALATFIQSLARAPSADTRAISARRIGLVLKEGANITSAVPHLIHSLSDSSGLVRYHAADVLTSFYVTCKSFEKLRQLLKSTNSAVKMAALDSMGRNVEDGRSIAPLMWDVAIESWNPDRDIGLSAYMLLYTAATYGDLKALGYLDWTMNNIHSEGFLVH